MEYGQKSTCSNVSITKCMSKVVVLLERASVRSFHLDREQSWLLHQTFNLERFISRWVRVPVGSHYRTNKEYIQQDFKVVQRMTHKKLD